MAASFEEKLYVFRAAVPTRTLEAYVYVYDYDYAYDPYVASGNYALERAIILITNKYSSSPLMTRVKGSGTNPIPPGQS